MSNYTIARDAVKVIDRHAATRITEFNAALAVVVGLNKWKNESMNNIFANEAAAVAIGFGDFVKNSPLMHIPEAVEYALYDAKESKKFTSEYAALKYAFEAFSKTRDMNMTLLAARTRLLMRFF